jgi:hypothetical protein
MPPSTDCSAGMSWGGFRLVSDPRVPSIESRCVTDKAAVLRCVPRWAARKSFILPGAELLNLNRTAYLQVYQRPPTKVDRAAPGESSPRGARKLSPQSTGYPQGVRLRKGSPWQRCQPAGNAFLHSRKQVSRNGSRPCPSLQARCPSGLWITCALRGIACAQSVHEPVETKKVCPRVGLSPAETHFEGCGLKILFQKPSSTAGSLRDSQPESFSGYHCTGSRPGDENYPRLNF